MEERKQEFLNIAFPETCTKHLWLQVLIILFIDEFPIRVGWNCKRLLPSHVLWHHCTNSIVWFSALQISFTNIPRVSSALLPDVFLLCRGNANQLPIRPENEFSRPMISQCMTSHTFIPAYNFHFVPPNTMQWRADHIQWQGMLIMPQLQVNPSLSSLVAYHLQDIGIAAWRTADGRSGRGRYSLATCHVLSVLLHRPSNAVYRGLSFFVALLTK
jgi:hypothetical protein